MWPVGTGEDRQNIGEGCLVAAIAALLHILDFGVIPLQKKFPFGPEVDGLCSHGLAIFTNMGLRIKAE